MLASRDEEYDFFPTTELNGKKAKVRDHYRWLEDTASTKTKTWINAQNMITESYLAKSKYRSKLREKITKTWDYPKYGLINK